MTSGYTPAASGNDKNDSVVDELQPGTKLLHGQYTITEFLNNGGFGITYLAKDSLDRTVVIKECFPNAFCRRSATLVRARSRAHTSELKSVVKLFVNEARNLSVLQHPNIVGVHQVFEDNETAYMAIDYIDGSDLLDLIEDRSLSFTPDDIVRIARKLISAVGYIHLNNMLHRDISPDNVLIDSTGEPVLIDFGAARVQASKQSRTLTALRVVKDGYSPQEFYIAGSEQGPWSDLYALGATLFHLITGETPVNGQERLAALAEGRADPHQKLAGRIPGYPEGFLEAVDAAMNVLPKERLQSADQWLDLIAKVNVRVIDEYRTVEDPISEPAEPADALAETVQSMVEAGQSAPAPSPSAPHPDEALTETLRATIEEPEPAKKRGGFGLVAAGVVVLAGVGMGAVEFTMPGGLSGLAGDKLAPVVVDGPVPVAQQEAPEAPPVPDTTETEQATVVTSAQAATALAALVAPATDSATAETVAEAQDTQPDPVVAAAASDTPAPIDVAAQQVAYAHWDVRVPFASVPRRANNANIAFIKDVPADAAASLPDWLTAGAAIYSVNGTALARKEDIAALLLSQTSAPEDGVARFDVSYKAAGSTLFENGTLEVPVLRVIGLANGVQAEIHPQDGRWQTVVTETGGTELQAGDMLIAETGTNTLLSGQDDLQSVMQTLVDQGASEARFDVRRDGAKISLRMPLAPKQDG